MDVRAWHNRSWLVSCFLSNYISLWAEYNFVCVCVCALVPQEGSRRPPLCLGRQASPTQKKNEKSRDKRIISIREKGTFFTRLEISPLRHLHVEQNYFLCFTVGRERPTTLSKAVQIEFSINFHCFGPSLAQRTAVHAMLYYFILICSIISDLL